MDLSEAGDEDLMGAVQNDDPEAFDELVRRYQTRLYRFALRRVGQSQAAEDVVQETFLRVWRYRARYRAGTRPGTWIFALCLNLARDHWRAQRPESSLENPETALAAEWSGLRTRPDDPSEAAARAEISQLLLEALGRLPGRTAQMLIDRSRQDLTLEDAGGRVGLGPQAARAAASRAYKKLRQTLGLRLGGRP